MPSSDGGHSITGTSYKRLVPTLPPPDSDREFRIIGILLLSSSDEDEKEGEDDMEGGDGFRDED